jgi:putative ABC transport system ATP-binding protein
VTEDRPPEPLVVANGVVKVYRSGTVVVTALDQVDVTITSGEFVAVVGPSGSGKSTLLNCLSGLEDIDGGSVTIDGVVLGQASDAVRTGQRAADMGFVFQAPALLPSFTAVENVALPLLLTQRGRDSRRVARRKANEALNQVGLADRVDHYPAELSGGEQQRVAIARALVKRPRLVWADEPTGNLDTWAANEVLALLDEMHLAGTTIVLVTHDWSIARRADRVIEMVDGRIAAIPSPSDRP